VFGCWMSETQSVCSVNPVVQDPAFSTSASRGA
jgi:hypothetical protein